MKSLRIITRYFRNRYWSFRQYAARKSWIRAIYLSLNMANALFQRDLKGKYRRSMLGHAWAILQPMMFLGLWITIRSFFGIKDTKIPYPILIFSGMIPWNFFMGIINGSTSTLLSNAGIIKKINIDREIFLLVNVMNSLFDMLMMLLLFTVMMIYYGIVPGWNALWAPLYLFLFGLLGFSVGMLISSYGIFKNDITLAFTYILQIWMFLNPIIYPLETVPARIRFYYLLNPTVPILESFRNSIVLNQPINWKYVLYSTCFTIISLLISWPLFRRRAAFFADEL